MKHIYPSYYPNFQCIASACRHSCCIGWEIDIDEDTAAYYAALGGTLGTRLRENINFGETVSFRLGQEERCPFLNRDNLCDLILTLGEESLCDICTEHPRFHLEYKDRTESGVGLCCEAAAELIMGQQEPFHLLHSGRKPAGAEVSPYLQLRDRLLKVLTNRKKPLEERCSQVMALCGGRVPQFGVSELAELFLSMEQLEPEWTERLRALEAEGEAPELKAYANAAAAFSVEYEQLLCYFIYRHFASDAEKYGTAAAAGAALLSVGMISALHALQYAIQGRIEFRERVEIARQYSAEIEYSDENPGVLLQVISNNN